MAAAKVYVDKDLATEMNAIQTALGSGSEEWEQRVDALHRLQDLVAGGATDLDAFVPLLEQMKVNLEKAVTDLRSQVAREACVCISVLAEAMGNLFEPLADYFIPVLLKLVPVSIKIISESANACVHSILRSTRVNRCIPKILAGLTSKAGPVRQRCAEYMLVLLQVNSTADLQRHADALEEAVRVGITDALPATRSSCRKAYWALNEHWPDRARNIMARLDPPTQRLVQEERAAYLAAAGATENDDVLADVPARAPMGKLHRAMSAGPLLRKNPDPAAAALGASSSSAASVGSAMGLGPSAAAAGAAGSHTVPAGSSVGPGLSRRPSADLLAPAGTVPGAPPSIVRLDSAPVLAGARPRADSMPSKQPALGGVMLPSRAPGAAAAPGGLAAPGAATVAQSALAGAQQAQAQALAPDGVRRGPGTRPMSAVQPMPAPVLLDAGGAAPSATAAGGPTGTGLRRFGSAAAFGSAPAVAGRPGRSASVGTAPAYGLSAGPMGAAAGESSASDVDEAAEEGLGAATEPAPTAELGDILAKATNALWSTRLECLADLRRMAHSERAGELLSAMERVMGVVMDKMADPHYKVIQESLDTCDALLSVYPAAMEPFLERVLPRLFAKLSDAKEAVRVQCHRVLDTVRTLYTGEIIVPVLLRVVENPNARVKIAALEFMMHVLQGAADVLPTAMKGCLQKLVPLLAEKAADLRRAAVATLLELYGLDQYSFAQQLPQLPLGSQYAIKKALGEHIPDVEAELSQLSKVRRTPSRPALRAEPDIASVRDDSAAAAALNVLSRSQGAADSGSVRSAGSSAQLAAAPSSYVPPPPPPPAHMLPMAARVPSSPSLKPASAPPGITAPPAAGRPGSAAGAPSTVQPQPQLQPQPQPQPQTQPPALVRAGSSSAAATGPFAGAPLHVGTAPVVPLGGSSAPATPTARPVTAAVPAGGAAESRPLVRTGSRTGLGDGGGSVASVIAESVAEVPPLLQQLSSPTSEHRRAALQRLQLIARMGVPQVWEQYFGQILLRVLESLQDPQPHVRESGLYTLGDMLRSQTALFSQYLNAVLMRLLECTRDAAREVTAAASMTMDTLVTVVEPTECVEVRLMVIGPLINSMDGPPLLELLRLLTKVVPRVPVEEMYRRLPNILPGLFENVSADVRKSVVFCLVELSLALGDRLQPHLAELSTSQLKLVTIYVNRAKERRGLLTAAEAPPGDVTQAV